MAASTTVAGRPDSLIVTERSSSSPRTSVSPARCSKRLRLTVPEESITEVASTPVTRPIGQKIRRRATTSTMSPSARGAAVPTRSAISTSRTLPTRSPLGSKTVSPASRETYARVTVVTKPPRWRSSASCRTAVSMRALASSGWRKATVAVVTAPGPDQLSYEVVDVFAPHPFSGNQLAVVLDAGDLTGEQCQALAAEFGFSESTFVSAPADDTADYRVRIFTPRTELPFAGHPSVGTAHTLVRLGRLPAGVLRQECGAGVVEVEIEGDGARLTGGTVSLRPGPEVTALAAALGLGPDDVTGRPAHLVGCGIDFAQLEVRPGAAARAVPDAAALTALLPGVQGGVSVLEWDGATRAGTVRVFADGLDFEEDPATGSAALGTGIWLAAEGLAGDGVTEYRLAQGALARRPSGLARRVVVAGGAVTEVSVAGAVRPLAHGP